MSPSRLRSLLTGAALALSAAGAVPAHASAAACRPAGSSTLAANATTRYFLSRAGGVYGCLYDADNRARFGRVAPGYRPALRHRRLVGPFLAFSTPASVAREEGETLAVLPRVTVLDARPHRSSSRLTRHSAVAGRADLGDDPRTVAAGRDPVTDLELTPAGDLAWIADFGAGSRSVYAVAGGLRAGPVRLASGAAIVPDSLRVRGATVSWLDGSTRRSRRLR